MFVVEIVIYFLFHCIALLSIFAYVHTLSSRVSLSTTYTNTITTPTFLPSHKPSFPSLTAHSTHSTTFLPHALIYPAIPDPTPPPPPLSLRPIQYPFPPLQPPSNPPSTPHPTPLQPPFKSPPTPLPTTPQSKPGTLDPSTQLPYSSASLHWSQITRVRHVRSLQRVTARYYSGSSARKGVSGTKCEGFLEVEENDVVERGWENREGPGGEGL